MELFSFSTVQANVYSSPNLPVFHFDALYIFHLQFQLQLLCCCEICCELLVMKRSLQSLPVQFSLIIYNKQQQSSSQNKWESQNIKIITWELAMCDSESVTIMESKMLFTFNYQISFLSPISFSFSLLLFIFFVIFCLSLFSSILYCNLFFTLYHFCKSFQSVCS